MFETLFTRPYILARHRASPCPEARERFLLHCSEQGFSRSFLRKIAWVLLVFSQSVDLCRPGRVTHQEIEFAVDHRVRFARRPEGADDSRSSRLLFIHIATAWLRFLGYLEEEPGKPKPFTNYIEGFANSMRDERGLSLATITFRREQIAHFLATVWRPDLSLSAISIQDIDAYLTHQGSRGWSRTSLHTLADALRSFFRYAEAQGWANGIAAAIEAPRRFAQEGLPLGPSWEAVQQLVASFSSLC